MCTNIQQMQKDTKYIHGSYWAYIEDRVINLFPLQPKCSLQRWKRYTTPFNTFVFFIILINIFSSFFNSKDAMSFNNGLCFYWENSLVFVYFICEDHSPSYCSKLGDILVHHIVPRHIALHQIASHLNALFHVALQHITLNTSLYSSLHCYKR